MVPPAFAQSSAIAGKVVQLDSLAAGVCAEGCPIADATVRVARTDGLLTRDAVTTGNGSFLFDSLTPGLYTVTARRLGYRNAELSGIRLAAGQTVRVQVRLTGAPRRLSTVQVLASPVTIDAMTTELPMHLSRDYTELLPSAREASTFISLVPGARTNQLWGGAPAVSNDYQLDGVSMNHPGLGGDFLSLSVDWIEALDVRGLGVGAESGNFQGGIINAITKSGTNDRRYALRTNYESARLTATNLNANEEGSEQAGRRELSGEVLGPIARDRLFYFAAGQFIRRDLRSPDLTTRAPRDFQPVREEHRDGRALGKLTWLPALGQRVDILAAYSSFATRHAGINGVDDASSTVAVKQPNTFYELSWNNSSSATNQVDVRLGGFTSRETRRGYAGAGVPGVQLFQLGRMPRYQNSVFDELRQPSSLGATAQWTTRQRLLGADHRAVLGADVSRGRWRNERTRNGGVTWRPYSTGVANFDPTNASTWQTVGSNWGGEMRLDSDIASDALFVQDYATLGSRLTITPGVRFGHWAGFAHPYCSSDPTASATCYRFEAVHATGLDPRVGVSWDVTGRNTIAVKAHWGRYHQGMFSLFFDRAAGVDAYTNERFYYTSPLISDSYRTYTTAERDAPGSEFGSFYDELILNESGRVESYRQPYVDQALVGVEKTFGSSWKLEVMYTNRRNGNIVGLLDRNIASNYTPIHNVAVDHRFISGVVLDANGQRLVLPTLYVSNKDLQTALAVITANAKFPPESLLGYSADYIRQLTWHPDLVLTTLPQAKRRYQQITVVLHAFRPTWRGEASLTGARLRGNVAGVTGYGTSGTAFSAGQFVRPNEAINAEGFLPDALEMEGKVWLTAQLPYALRGGLVYTHIVGERFAPTFQILGRYRYARQSATSPGEVVPDEALRGVLGQTILVEPRGSRQYASRDLVDAHLEWHSRLGPTLTLDAFNVLGSNALVLINTNIGDQEPSDPTSLFGASRLRVSPRSLRIGLRIE
jgi:hypothetical protein